MYRNEYIKEHHRPIPDRECSPLTTCTADEYETRPNLPRLSPPCAALTVCITTESLGQTSTPRRPHQTASAPNPAHQSSRRLRPTPGPTVPRLRACDEPNTTNPSPYSVLRQECTNQRVQHHEYQSAPATATTDRECSTFPCVLGEEYKHLEANDLRRAAPRTRLARKRQLRRLRRRTCGHADIRQDMHCAHTCDTATHWQSTRRADSTMPAAPRSPSDLSPMYTLVLPTLTSDRQCAPVTICNTVTHSRASPVPRRPMPLVIAHHVRLRGVPVGVSDLHLRQAVH